GRVELLAGGVERGDAGPAESFAQLAMDQPHPINEGVVGGGGLQGALEVVERGDDVSGKRGLRLPLRVGCLLAGALAEVLEVRLGALGELEVLVALALAV